MLCSKSHLNESFMLLGYTATAEQLLKTNFKAEFVFSTEFANSWENVGKRIFAESWGFWSIGGKSGNEIWSNFHLIEVTWSAGRQWCNRWPSRLLCRQPGFDAHRRHCCRVAIFRWLFSLSGLRWLVKGGTRHDNWRDLAFPECRRIKKEKEKS